MRRKRKKKDSLEVSNTTLIAGGVTLLLVLLYYYGSNNGKELTEPKERTPQKQEAGAIAVAFAVQKAFGKRLGVPMTMEGALMLAAAIAGGTLIVNYLQAEKYLPEELGN